MISLSIITICYNCFEELPGTVESVRDQTYDEIEHIVIDGHSDDGTAEWLAEHRDWFDVLVSERDEGRYHAMNKGLKEATGDYVMFLHAGDKLRTESAIENLLTKPDITKERPKIISGRMELTIDNEPLNLTRPWRTGKEGPGLPHPATLVDREFHQEYKFDTQFNYVADYELWTRLRDEGKYEVRYVPDVITFFDVEGASNSPDLAFARYLERLFVDYKYGRDVDLYDAFFLLFTPKLRQTLNYLLGKRYFVKILRYRRLVYRLARNESKS
jgi:glycosyltransferase